VRSITDGRFIYSRNFMPFMPQMRYIRYFEIADITNVMRDDLKNGQLNSFQKSIFDARPAEFLFDIENDIWEQNNLAENPEYAAVLKKMQRQLDSTILDSRDVLFLPEYEINRISENETPYEFRLNEKKYPFSEIYAAASLSGKRGAEIAKQQIELLGSSNKIIRYWAIVGLQSQNSDDLKDYKKDVLRAVHDEYLPVAVTASAIAYQNFASAEAEQKLKEFCAKENLDIALMAINYLLYINNKEPFIETIKSVYKMSNRNYNVKAACLDFLGILKLVANDFEHGS
jgi:hypothetical protein